MCACVGACVHVCVCVCVYTVFIRMLLVELINRCHRRWCHVPRRDTSTQTFCFSVDVTALRGLRFQCTQLSRLCIRCSLYQVFRDRGRTYVTGSNNAFTNASLLRRGKIPFIANRQLDDRETHRQLVWRAVVDLHQASDYRRAIFISATHAAQMRSFLIYRTHR